MVEEIDIPALFVPPTTKDRTEYEDNIKEYHRDLMNFSQRYGHLVKTEPVIYDVMWNNLWYLLDEISAWNRDDPDILSDTIDMETKGIRNEVDRLDYLHRRVIYHLYIRGYIIREWDEDPGEDGVTLDILKGLWAEYRQRKPEPWEKVVVD